MARYRLPGIMVLVLTLSFAGSAFGQSQEAAERKSAEGRAFYDQEKFDLALASFKEAHALHPSSRYLFNSAKACVRLGDGEGTIYFFERYLTSNPVAEDRAKVLAEVEKVRGELLAAGRREVRLEVVPVEAAIVLPDDHPSEVVLAPASLFLASGSYLVGIRAEGYLDQTVTVEIPADGPSPITVEVSLEVQVAGIPDDKGGKIEPVPTPFPWHWVMLGVGGAGVVAAGTGSFLWYDGWSGMGSANDAGAGPNYSANYRSARDRYVAGQWVTAAGAVVAAGGLVGYYLWPRQAGAPAPAISLLPRDDGFLLGFGAWF